MGERRALQLRLAQIACLSIYLVLFSACDNKRSDTGAGGGVLGTAGQSSIDALSEGTSASYDTGSTLSTLGSGSTSVDPEDLPLDESGQIDLTDASKQDMDDLASLYNDAFKGIKSLDPNSFPDPVIQALQTAYCQSLPSGFGSYPIVGNPGLGSTNAYQYLAGLYLDTVGMLPLSPIADWLTILSTRGPKELARRILISEQNIRQLVGNFYHFLLQKTAPEDRLRAWVVRLGKHQEGEPSTRNSIESMLVHFIQVESGKRYWRLHTGKDAFVTALYQDLLGRVPDPSGYDFWTKGKNYSEEAQRRDTARGFVESVEFRTNFIVRSHWQYLGRGPTGTELYGHLNNMKGGRDMISVMSDILGSFAYISQQGRRFNPSLPKGLCQ